MKTTFFVAAVLALAAPLGRAAERDSGYVAHEWGTFTSVQGADGVQLEWNPLQTVDLPRFVYNLMNPGLAYQNFPRESLIAMQLSKGQFRSRQRMETPVIYFYSDQPRTVDIAVDFPEGTITEWYPQGVFVDTRPAAERTKRGFPPRNAMRWNKLSILPAGEKADLPSDGTGNHYYAARETDANLVRVKPDGAQAETDKFIFYRGVGQFVAPLTVKLDGSNADKIILENTSKHRLGRLFVFEVRAGQAWLEEVASLEAKATATLSWPPAHSSEPLVLARPKLAARMSAALAADGLYEREAAAMVKTWDDSWFAEEGLRVLYVLPGQWTDEILPLKLSPAPREVVRVFVGRAEMITPQAEAVLAVEIDRYLNDGEAGRVLAVQNTRRLGLGRFAEPALRRFLDKKEHSKAYVTASWDLIRQANRKPAAVFGALSF